MNTVTLNYTRWRGCHASTSVSSFWYNDNTEDLYVVFKSDTGTVYHYRGVPGEVATALLSADSAGGAYYTYVSGRYGPAVPLASDEVLFGYTQEVKDNVDTFNPTPVDINFKPTPSAEGFKQFDVSEGLPQRPALRLAEFDEDDRVEVEVPTGIVYSWDVTLKVADVNEATFNTRASNEMDALDNVFGLFSEDVKVLATSITKYFD